MEQEACGGMRQSDTERCREIQSNTERYTENSLAGCGYICQRHKKVQV